MYGPPVRPPQPNMGLESRLRGGIDSKISTGEVIATGGVFTPLGKVQPLSFDDHFDAPNREVCTVRRDRTNTPLQAPCHPERSGYRRQSPNPLARIMLKAGDAPADRLEAGSPKVPCPLSGSRAELDRLVCVNRFGFVTQRPRTRKEDGDRPDRTKLLRIRTADLAALTVAGNVLLNLDEMLMKR